MVHADLEHRALGVPSHSGQRQRHADMVVVGLHGRMRPTGQRQACHHRLGDAGLADRPGHGTPTGVHSPLARRATQQFESGHRIGDDDRRRCHSLRRQHARRALAHRQIDKVMTVPGAGQRDEQVAGFQAACVYGNPGGREVTAGRAAGRRCNFTRCPERRGRDPVTHGPTPGPWRSLRHRRTDGRWSQQSDLARGLCRPPPGHLHPATTLQPPG